MREFPRVKHNHLDAILECRIVAEKAYCEQITINSKDPFLKAGSKQEQNLYMELIEDRIQEDPHNLEMNKNRRKNHKQTFLIKNLNTSR